MAHSQASTIYMSGETARMAREIEDLTGVKASRLFREFIQRYRRTIHPEINAPVDSLAFVLPAVSPWDVNAPRPFLSRLQGNSSSGHDVWQWVFDPAYPRAFKVFLMGKSLEHPITNHEDLWTEFIDSGGVLEVLFQGDISSGADPIPKLFATADPAVNSSKLTARRRTLQFLSELEARKPGSVEIRNSGQVLLTMNAGLIFRDDGTVDIYMEFSFGETLGLRSSTVTMMAEHDPPDSQYRLIAGAMEGLWLRSVPEPDFVQEH